MKYSQLIGIIAAIALSIACFYPWAFYPDLNTYFTGFYSHQNLMANQEKLLVFLSVVAILFFAFEQGVGQAYQLDRMRHLAAAFALKTYILFTSCYRGICPDKQTAVVISCWVAPFIMLMIRISAKNKNRELGIGSPNLKSKI